MKNEHLAMLRLEALTWSARI